MGDGGNLYTFWAKALVRLSRERLAGLGWVAGACDSGHGHNRHRWVGVTCCVQYSVVLTREGRIIMSIIEKPPIEES